MIDGVNKVAEYGCFTPTRQLHKLALLSGNSKTMALHTNKVGTAAVVQQQILNGAH